MCFGEKWGKNTRRHQTFFTIPELNIRLFLSSVDYPQKHRIYQGKNCKALLEFRCCYQIAKRIEDKKREENPKDGADGLLAKCPPDEISFLQQDINIEPIDQDGDRFEDIHFRIGFQSNAPSDVIWDDPDQNQEMEKNSSRGNANEYFDGGGW